MQENERQVTIKQVNTIAAVIVGFFVLNYLMKFISVANPEQKSSLLDWILAVGLVAAVFMSAANFELSIVIFIFVAPLTVYNIPHLKFFFTYGDAYLIVLVFIWIGRMVLGHEMRPPKTFLDRLIFFFILFTLLSAISSYSTSAAVREIVQTLEYFVFCYYLFTVAVNRRDVLDCLIHAIVLCGGMLAVYGVIQYFRMGGGSFRIPGTFAHFNAMGTFMAMMITFVFNLVLAEKNRLKRIFYYVILGVDTVAILLTFSRGAWMGVIVGLILSAQIRGMVQFIRVFAVVIVVFLVVAVVTPPQFMSRYLGRIYSVPRVEDSASKSRLRQWQIAAETISEYPLLGVGLTNNRDYVTQKYGEPQNGEIHNLFLHIASERGVASALILLAMFGAFFLHIMKRIRRTEDPFFHSLYVALFAVVVSYGVVNIFAYQLIRGLGLFFAIFLGLYQAAMYIEEHEPVESKWAEMLSSLETKHSFIKMGL
jgi:putative inorganic carbon (hco3(-)) transporter